MSCLSKRLKQDVYFEELAMGTSRETLLFAHSIMVAALRDIVISRSRLLKLKNAKGEIVGMLPFSPMGIRWKEGK
jgi:hypothetical protein